MTAPCKDCPDRRAHCHSCCEKYKSWRAEYDRIQAARHKEKMIQHYIDDTKIRLHLSKHGKNRNKYKK